VLRHGLVCRRAVLFRACPRPTAAVVVLRQQRAAAFERVARSPRHARPALSSAGVSMLTRMRRHCARTRAAARRAFARTATTHLRVIRVRHPSPTLYDRERCEASMKKIEMEGISIEGEKAQDRWR